MIIRRMSADFGVLKDAGLELQPGLNVICTPNGTGKSTWCAFLRTMLYGPDTSRRRTGEKPDRIRYSPWDGTPPSGSMDLISRGREITLRRSTVNPGAPMRSFSAVYTETGMPVSGLSESDAGEILTGMSLPVFRRTAFISAGEMALTAAPELEKKIAALLTSGEEDAASYTEAAERLRRWDRKCSYRGQGYLPELDRRIAALERQLQERGALAQELDQAEITAEKARLLADSLKDDGPSGGESAAFLRERERLELERRAMDREQEARTLRDTLYRGPFRDRKPDAQVRDRVRKDAAHARELQKRMERLTPPGWVTAVCLLLMLLTLAAGILWHSPVPLAAAAVFLCLGVIWQIRRYTLLQNHRADARELNALLKRYGVSSPEEMESRFQRSLELWQESEALLAAAGELRREAAALKTAPIPPEKENPKRREAEENCARAAARAARLRGRLDTLEGADVLSSELSRARRERETWSRRRQALSLAAEALARADEEMQLRFAPALKRRAEEILFRLTGGRCDSLALGRDLSLSVGEGGSVPRESGFLSRGTLDQTYLALRLALCDLLPMDEPCPLVLDDALLSFDDERMGLALDLLSELAQHRQVILFTCRHRELDRLDGQDHVSLVL